MLPPSPPSQVACRRKLPVRVLRGLSVCVGVCLSICLSFVNKKALGATCPCSSDAQCVGVELACMALQTMLQAYPAGGEVGRPARSVAGQPEALFLA